MCPEVYNLFKKFRVKIDEAIRKDFFDHLTRLTKTHASELQKSKYDLENLSIKVESSPNLEENLMDENFPEIEGAENAAIFHIEIKMKSSLDVISSSDLGGLIDCFLTDKTDTERAAIVETISTLSSKRNGAEYSQSFLRDNYSLMDNKLSEKKPQKKSQYAFDGRAFFLADADQRVGAIRMIAERETNYFRFFDRHGQRLHFDDYNNLLSATFEDWRSTFCTIVSQSLSTELLRAITFLQNTLGNSLGDSVVKLCKLQYHEVKEQKGAAYLSSLSDLILRAILELLNEADLSIKIDVSKNYFSQIKQKVVVWLGDGAQDYKDLDLMITYVCILTSMTFCDSSAIIKIAVSPDKTLQTTAVWNEKCSKLTTGQVSDAKHVYHFASKSTLIDFGTKKDSNLANLLETFKGLACYSTYLSQTHGLN
jgi:hypothetical protein